ncbi:arsenate reductase ArsC [Methanoregula sp.]|uniref:arsenate reductase ArsC n=1 Tax=Methanoregula sp. TaxID=2052170 RepID=UPI002D0AB659|nr:arsenate reductase ArsC [Methanoregula sp.]HVP97011.1 arsenate reductase ArsC [Methanoregula sp.]
MASGKNERVIFICSFNSVRSPIAEGLFRQRTNDWNYTIFSAGIAPIRVRPYAVRIMQESGIDISGHVPASLYQYRNSHFDYVVTLCDNARTTAEDVLSDSDHFLHKNFVSPQEIGRSAEETLIEYRQLRDHIAAWLEDIFPGHLSDPGREYLSEPELHDNPARVA